MVLEAASRDTKITACQSPPPQKEKSQNDVHLQVQMVINGPQAPAATPKHQQVLEMRIKPGLYQARDDGATAGTNSLPG